MPHTGLYEFGFQCGVQNNGNTTPDQTMELSAYRVTAAGVETQTHWRPFEFVESDLAGTGEVPYFGSGSVEFAVSALAGSGMIDSTGSGDLSLPVTGLIGTGTLTVYATGDVNFGFALAGKSELADTGRGFKHYQQVSNIDRVLRLN